MLAPSASRLRASSAFAGVLAGVLLTLLLASPAAAAAPRFLLVTAQGTTESLGYVGYTFGVTTPPIGKHGTLQVDCPVADEAAVKRALPVGTRLASARLVISATLPHPQHVAYVLAGAKVAAISFVTGHFGPTAAITLSFTKLST